MCLMEEVQDTERSGYGLAALPPLIQTQSEKLGKKVLKIQFDGEKSGQI